MKAALCTSLDGISAVHVTDVPEPDWVGDDIVVRVRYVGLNHSDVLRSLGKYQDKADLPFSPGGEIAGIVEQASALSGFHVGQRVMAYIGHGGARERIAVPPERLVAIPDAVSDEVAAGVPITYGTALHAFRERTVIEPGETIAILGAGGGAGLAAIEVGKLLGAHVLAVASRDKHVACLNLGADAAIDRDTPDLKQVLRDLTKGHGGRSGEGPAVIYDCVGGALAEPAFRALRNGGHYLVVGFASRTVPVLPLNIALVKALTIVGINWPSAVVDRPDGHRADMALALAAIAAGQLHPRVHGVWPLDRICEALGVLDRGEASGKVVVSVE